MKRIWLVLLLTAPAWAQGASAQESAMTGLGCALVGLILVWKRRCKQLPQYLPGDVRPTLQVGAPRQVPPPKAMPLPEPELVKAPTAPPPQIEFEYTPVKKAPEDLVFEPAPAPPPPEPEPEFDPAPLEEQFLEIQGQFEQRAADFAQRLEQEWQAMQAFLQQPREAVPGPLAVAIPEIEALGPEQATTGNPAPPPDEIDPKGWSEPAENGVRARNGEFLGPLGDPSQPPGPTNARAYYRERRIEGDVVFREITRGIVVGRQLQIQESARYPEHGIPTLLEAHKRYAAEAGAPVAFRVWLTAERAIRIFGTLKQAQAVEAALLELPSREKVPDILVARDLGGRVDWEGNYFHDEEGRPQTHAVLRDDTMLALRHGLEPAALKAALEEGLLA